MIDPAPGILLIADPFLKDPSFIRTVVFLCEHRDAGSFGFVLNKQIDSSLGELIPDLEGCSIPVYFGGPVQPDTVHFLHQYPDLIPDASPVGDGIYWGGNFETVTALLKSKSINPAKIKFFIGYSGWGDGQLGEEMKERSWITVSATRNLVFDTRHGEIWKGSLQALGGDYEMMINFPIDPQLN